MRALRSNPDSIYRLEQRGAPEKIFSINNLNPKLAYKIKE